MKVKAYYSPVDAYTFCQEEQFGASQQLPIDVYLPFYHRACVRLDNDTFAYVSNYEYEAYTTRASVVRIDRDANTVQVVANLSNYRGGVGDPYNQAVALDSTHWLQLSQQYGTGVLFTLNGSNITVKTVNVATRLSKGAFQAKDGVVIVNNISDNYQSYVNAISLDSNGNLVIKSLGGVSTRAEGRLVKLDKNVYGISDDSTYYDKEYITPFMYDPATNTISVKKQIIAGGSHSSVSVDKTEYVPLGNRKVYFRGQGKNGYILTFADDWNSTTYSRVTEDIPVVTLDYGIQNYDIDTGSFVTFVSNSTTPGLQLWKLNSEGTDLELKNVIPVGVIQLDPGYYGYGNTLLYRVVTAGFFPAGLYWSTADIVNPETYVRVAEDRVDGLLLTKASGTRYGNYFKWDPSVPMSAFGISERLADEIKSVSIMEVQNELNK